MPGPTAADFAQNFGLAQLIRKSLAITRDLRMTRNGAAEFVERVLTITSEDTLSIDRKFRPAWTGALPTRLMFLSNDPLGTATARTAPPRSRRSPGNVTWRRVGAGARGARTWPRGRDCENARE